MPKTIGEYSVEELQEAIDTKKKQERKISLLPVSSKDPGTKKRLLKLQRAVVTVKEKEERGNPDPDTHYVYEAAMELFYGDYFWEWLKKVASQ